MTDDLPLKIRQDFPRSLYLEMEGGGMGGLYPSLQRTLELTITKQSPSQFGRGGGVDLTNLHRAQQFAG